MTVRHRRTIVMASMTVRCIVLAGLTALAPGCTSPADDPALDGWPVPPDFSLQLHGKAPAADGATSASRDIADMTCHFVVEPDRKLRVGFGRRVTARVHPAVREVLTPAQMRQLYRFIRQRGLLDPPPQPPPPGDGSTRYELAITAGSQTLRYQTTREQTPAAAELIYMLADFGAIERTP